MNRSTCRSCDASLQPLFSLGDLAFTGRFPEPGQSVPRGELELGICELCQLVQLVKSFDSSELYREGYGYRSGINASMRSHLKSKASSLVERYNPSSVIDIGSNDGTTLNCFVELGVNRLAGVDPLATLLGQNYHPSITTIDSLFTRGVPEIDQSEPFDLCTTISMFYDLEDPVDFARLVSEILNADGVWHLEQSYLPSMLRSQGFDTICHEHIEYYSLTSLSRILEEAGFVVIRCRLNGVNGGSFEVDAVKRESDMAASVGEEVPFLLRQEQRLGIGSPETYFAFFDRVKSNLDDLRECLADLSSVGLIGALGASTKGNVLLQVGGLAEFISAVGEVNADKFGCVTPGTAIPIIPQDEVLNGDYHTVLILPWHFRETFLMGTEAYRSKGGRVIFPLPFVEVV